jgi:hypothetical protein
LLSSCHLLPHFASSVLTSVFPPQHCLILSPCPAWSDPIPQQTTMNTQQTLKSLTVWRLTTHI